MRIFIATTSFAALSLLFAIFTRIGRLDIPSSTDMAFNPGPASTFSHSRGTSSVEKRHTEDKCSSAPHNSGPGGGDARVWSGAQVAPRSSSLLANIGGILSRPTVDDTPVSTPPPQTEAAAAAAPQPTSLPQQPQRNSTLTADRVIWLVCEDCGSSRRMVEPVGDPQRYFYDDEEGGGDRCAARGGASGCRRVVPAADSACGGGRDVAGRRFPLGTV